MFESGVYLGAMMACAFCLGMEFHKWNNKKIHDRSSRTLALIMADFMRDPERFMGQYKTWAGDKTNEMKLFNKLANELITNQGDKDERTK